MIKKLLVVLVLAYGLSILIRAHLLGTSSKEHAEKFALTLASDWSIARLNADTVTRPAGAAEASGLATAKAKLGAIQSIDSVKCRHEQEMVADKKTVVAYCKVAARFQLGNGELVFQMQEQAEQGWLIDAFQVSVQ